MALAQLLNCVSGYKFIDEGGHTWQHKQNSAEKMRDRHSDMQAEAYQSEQITGGDSVWNSVQFPKCLTASILNFLS
jgi:hypothetical protein